MIHNVSRGETVDLNTGNLIPRFEMLSGWSLLEATWDGERVSRR